MGINNDRKNAGLAGLVSKISGVLVPIFALFFRSFALLYATSAIFKFINPVRSDGDLARELVKGLHMGLVALVLNEMAQKAHQEYNKSGKAADAIKRIRRSVTRFGCVVFVAKFPHSLRRRR